MEPSPLWPQARSLTADPGVASVPLPMRTILAILVVAVCLAGCRGEAPAVARLSVEPHDVQLPYPDLRPVRFNWQPVAPLGQGAQAASPEVFVHLLDGKGKVIRTFDHPFPGAWQEGVPASYEVKLFQSALAAPLAAGRYRLTAGLYGAGGTRWPLAAGQRVARDEYAVATVEVPGAPPAGAAPRFAYSGAWLPSEAASDRQFLARRWLEGVGTIEVSGLPGPGSVWLVLSIPDGKGEGEQVVYDAGANAPEVLVSASCGGMETGFSGAGRHEKAISVDPGASHGACELRLKPNFTLLSHGRPRRSVALDAIAWSPGASAHAAGSADAG